MKYFLALFFITYSSLIFGQFDTIRYSTKWVNTDNGLKQLSVRYCVPDNNGYIWIGTELGLYRYDGSNLIEINDERFPSLNKQRITRLGKDKLTGKIYLETNPEFCQYVIENNKIERIDPKKYWKNAIFTSSDFCYADSNPLIKNAFKNTNIENVIKEYSSNTFLTASLTSNFLYLPLYEHIIAFDKNGFISEFNCKFTSGVVLMQFGENVLATDRGKITLISEGKIVQKKVFVDAKIQSYLKRNLTNQSDIEIFGGKNNYYLKYNGVIYKITYGNNTLKTNFLFNAPAEDITSINFFERENIYCIGTRTKGMAILKPILFNTIELDEKKSNKSVNYCYSVIEISNKTWYSASGWMYNPNKPNPIVDNFLIDYRNTRFILPYKNKYYINCKENFWNIENKKNDFDLIFPKLGKKNYAGFTGYTFHKGQLYLTYTNKVLFLKNDTLVSNNILDKKFKQQIINSICSVNSSIIIATCKGVYNYIPETKKIYIIKGLERVNARYIKPINHSSFWVGCYGEGLYLVNQGKVHKVVDKNIDISTAHAIEEDAEGNLWISTNDGLLEVNKQIALKKILLNQPIYCYKYSTNDGLLTNEFNGGGTHPSLHTKIGIIGFTSMKGFVWFNPRKLTKHIFKGNIVLDKLMVNNEFNIKPKNNEYVITKDADVIKFNFSYGYYYNRENLTITYRFEDQKNWTEIKGNSFQIGRYKNGNYKLLIRITTHGFEENGGIIKVVPLNFEARYYETFWFWGIAIFCFFSFIYLSYLLGLHIQRKNEKILEKKIEEKTNILRDTVLELEASKNEVNQSLNEKKVLLKEVHHRVKNNLQLIISMLNIQARRNNYIDIYEFLKKGETRISSMALIHQSLYQSEDSLDKINFQLYIEDLVDSINKTFDNNNDKIQIVVDIKNVIVNLSTAIPLGLIINELVTNSLKHAFPNDKKGLVSIKIENVSKIQFKLIVEDNGVGFINKKKQTKSFGLDLITLLASQLKGYVEFDGELKTKYIVYFQEI